MFKTKNNPNKNTDTTEKKSPFTTAKNWTENKFGSLIIGSAIGYSLYHFGIISQIKNYLTNLTKKNQPTPTEPTTQTTN